MTVFVLTLLIDVLVAAAPLSAFAAAWIYTPRGKKGISKRRGCPESGIPSVLAYEKRHKTDRVSKMMDAGRSVRFFAHRAVGYRLFLSVIAEMSLEATSNPSERCSASDAAFSGATCATAC